MTATQPLLGETDRGATISPCGRYRYHLWRRWSHQSRCLFVMLNMEACYDWNGYSWAYQGPKNNSRVSDLVRDETKVPRSELGKVFTVWRARDYDCSSLASIRKLSRRHGPTSSRNDAGPQRQRWSVQSGKLPLGNCQRAEEQSSECRNTEDTLPIRASVFRFQCTDSQRQTKVPNLRQEQS